jgi:hypothetical protein
MEFETFLRSKKIDPQQFLAKNQSLFLKWQSDFEQYHPDSFVAQHKFEINQIRKVFRIEE